MSRAKTASQEPRLLHALPGRMRVHVAGWSLVGQGVLEARLHQVPGVHSVRINPLTGNVLIRFDPTATDEQTLLAAVPTLTQDSITCRRDSEVLRVSPAVPHRRTRSRSAADAGLRLAGAPDVLGPASILQNRSPRRLSLDIVDLSLKAAGIAVSLLLADSLLGLIFSGAEIVCLFLDVVRLFMKVIGRLSGRRRGEAQQDHGLLILIAPGDAGTVDVPEPIGRGRTRRYARAPGRHGAPVRPAAL